MLTVSNAILYSENFARRVDLVHCSYKKVKWEETLGGDGYANSIDQSRLTSKVIVLYMLCTTVCMSKEIKVK